MVEHRETMARVAKIEEMVKDGKDPSRAFEGLSLEEQKAVYDEIKPRQEAAARRTGELYLPQLQLQLDVKVENGVIVTKDPKMQRVDANAGNYPPGTKLEVGPDPERARAEQRERAEQAEIAKKADGILKVARDGGDFLEAYNKLSPADQRAVAYRIQNQIREGNNDVPSQVGSRDGKLYRWEPGQYEASAEASKAQPPPAESQPDKGKPQPEVWGHKPTLDQRLKYARDGDNLK